MKEFTVENMFDAVMRHSRGVDKEMVFDALKVLFWEGFIDPDTHNEFILKCIEERLHEQF